MYYAEGLRSKRLSCSIYNLYTRKQTLEQDLDLYKDIVTPLSNFTIPVERDNGLMYYAKKYIPLIFIFALLALIMGANRSALKELFNKY